MPNLYYFLSYLCYGIMIISIFCLPHNKIRFIEGKVIDVYTPKIILNFTLFIRV